MTRAIVHIGLPSLSGHPAAVGLRIACPFAPYVRPHTFQLEVSHDEWVALLRRKCGLKDVAPDVESGRVEAGWEPYRQVVMDEHQMELNIRCPLCGKDFTGVIDLPDWSRNIVLAAIEEEGKQENAASSWSEAAGLEMVDAEASDRDDHKKT